MDTWATLRTALAAAVVLAVGVGGAASARAAFPGENGTIVFRSNRTGNADVYTMNPDGTNRVNLTRNPAEDVDPRWSPDGSRIAFSSDRTGIFQIYTMAADGTDVRQLTTLLGHNRRPSWTSDGRILFQSDVDDPAQAPDIFVMNADGTGVTNLTRSPGTYDVTPAAAPRGNRIVFSSDRSGGYRLYLTGAGAPLREVTTGAGQDVQANWSPSGNDLVFVRFDANFSASDLYVVHANGTGLRQLTSTPGRYELEPAWSPDGTKIVFHACAIGADHCANYTMNADGTGEAEVTKVPVAPFVDDFSSAPLDEFWSTQVRGTGPSVQQANGRLELTLPSGTTLDPGVGFAQPAVFSKCNLRGDFDMQVDYSLLQWPSPDNVLADFAEGNFVGGNWASGNGMFVSRWGMSANMPPLPAVFVPGFFPSGTLRLTRHGSTLTESYLAGGAWVQLQSRDDLVADESDATLDIFSNAASGANGDVEVAYDNFQVTSGTFSCPTWWDDNAPDWQAR